MPKGNDVAPTGRLPSIDQYGPLADHYKGQSTRCAAAAALAMQRGDIQKANELYRQGHIAESCYRWYSRLAKFVPEMTTMKGT